MGGIFCRQEDRQSEFVTMMVKKTRMKRDELEKLYKKVFLQRHKTGEITKKEFQDFCLESMMKNFGHSTKSMEEQTSKFAEKAFNYFVRKEKEAQGENTTFELEPRAANADDTVGPEIFMELVDMAIFGSLQEKLAWAFDVYDDNGDKSISRDEASQIITAIYSAVGGDWSQIEHNTEISTAELFNIIDVDHDNRLSRDEFINGPRTAHVIAKLLLETEEKEIIRAKTIAKTTAIAAASKTIEKDDD